MRSVQLIADPSLQMLPLVGPDAPAVRVRTPAGQPQIIELQWARPVTDGAVVDAEFLLTGASSVGNLRLPQLDLAEVQADEALAGRLRRSGVGTPGADAGATGRGGRARVRRQLGRGPADPAVGLPAGPGGEPLEHCHLAPAAGNHRRQDAGPGLRRPRGGGGVGRQVDDLLRRRLPAPAAGPPRPEGRSHRGVGRRPAAWPPAGAWTPAGRSRSSSWTRPPRRTS